MMNYNGLCLVRAESDTMSDIGVNFWPISDIQITGKVYYWPRSIQNSVVAFIKLKFQYLIFISMGLRKRLDYKYNIPTKQKTNQTSTIWNAHVNIHAMCSCPYKHDS